MRIGLISDTHRVVDEAALDLLEGVDMILHAGDIGHHGGHAEVVTALRAVAPVVAVCGNVDDGANEALFPPHQLLMLNGWKVLVKHVVGAPPDVAHDVLQLVKTLEAEVVVFGHSHRACDATHDGVRYVNPGSAGPARFKLGRSVAIVYLPERSSGEAIQVELLPLPGKAPPALPLSGGDAFMSDTRSQDAGGTTAELRGTVLASKAVPRGKKKSRCS